MIKGEQIVIKIEKSVFGGEGLGFYDNKAVFVPESVPGDELEIEIISSKKDYSRGLIKRVITSSTDRVTPICGEFNQCGGCDYMMIDYKKQLVYKKEMVKEVIEKIGRTKDFILYDTLGMEEPFYYRNKVIQPFADKNGKIISGFYKKKSHEIVNNDFCYIQPVISNKILKKIKEILNKNRISIYDERSHSGLLRNIMVRTNSSNEAMVVFVINGEKLKNDKEIINELTKEFKEIKSIYISINKKRTNFIIGDRNIVVFGESELSEKLNGIEFFINPISFFQVNYEQTKILYNKAIEFLGDINDKCVVDAYSGTGTIASIISKNAGHVYGIEIVSEAIDAANVTSKLNGLGNIKYINGKVEEELIKLVDSGIKVDKIIFDPPRKGLEKEIIDKIAEVNIDEVVYISCNPATFSRDVSLFGNAGYELEKVQPVDMFPNTHHIELVAKLLRRKR